MPSCSWFPFQGMVKHILHLTLWYRFHGQQNLTQRLQLEVERHWITPFLSFLLHMKFLSAVSSLLLKKFRTWTTFFREMPENFVLQSTHFFNIYCNFLPYFYYYWIYITSENFLYFSANCIALYLSVSLHYLGLLQHMDFLQKSIITKTSSYLCWNTRDWNEDEQL